MSELKSLDNHKFELASQAVRRESEIEVTNTSYLKDVFQRLKANKGALIGLVGILVVILFAIFGPMLSGHTSTSMIVEHAFLPPRIPGLEKLGIFNGFANGMDVYASKGLENIYYWFGTDNLGRDLFTRVWEGTRISLYIAGIAVVIDMIIGMGYGLISGYIGGKVDMIMQRCIEVLSGIPNLVIVTLLVLILKPGILSITIALFITGWIGMSRIVRAQVLKLKEQEFILASKTLGASTTTILIKEIIPNIFGQVIIMSMFSIPNAIFTESFLAFIGLGLQAPMASLGVLISEGFKVLIIKPYLIAGPVIVLAILMLSFNLLADGLRDAFDPKLKEM